MTQLKLYKLAELRQIARKQSYKMAALEGPDGRRLLSFNTLKKGDDIQKKLESIPTALDNELRPDGVYYVLMAHNISTSRNPDRYPIAKGNVNAELLAEAVKKDIPLSPTTIIHSSNTDVRGWDKALSDAEKIANLTADNERLKQQVNELHKQVEELEAELEELEAQELSDPAENPTASLLKELVPQALPLLDRYFEQQDKRLEIERLKLNGHSKSAPAGRKTAPRRREIVAGSGEHLQVIEDLFNQEKDEQLNIELDKLQAASPELYAQVVERLGLEEESDEEGGGNA